MIKINILCVGKVKEKYFSMAIEEYKKRLSRFCKLDIIEVKEENIFEEPNFSQIEIIKEKEGENLSKKLSGIPILLDVKGEKISSEELATLIKKSVDNGEELTFIIGGSYGVCDKIKEISKKKISFSNMTFPHTLARVILTEQIYRAFKINENSRYHK